MILIIGKRETDMRFNKYDIVTEGTDDRKVGTIAARHHEDEHEANPRYLVTWHNRPAEWVRSEYLYRKS